VLGIGYPTLVPDKGTPAIKIADVDGVRVGALLRQGAPETADNHVHSPTLLQVGGAGPGNADAMVTINSNDVIGDNAWLWRADHGAGATWADAKNKNGLVVNGNNVIYYGLAVEHTQEYQTLWNGNGGRVYFYQSEIPYDVPDQNTWRPGSNDGCASYKVADNGATHEAWGLGVYSLFNAGACALQNAYETPSAPGIKLHHLNSIRLGGNAAGANGIAHVINGAGGGGFMRVTPDEWPVAAK
jgi:hypothetical protein